MKKQLTALLLTLTLLAAAPLALAASPTGATPAETSVYQAPGPAPKGLPAHALNTLGEAKGNAFMAERRLHTQTGLAEYLAALAAAIQAGTVAPGMPFSDEVIALINAYFNDNAPGNTAQSAWNAFLEKQSAYDNGPVRFASYAYYLADNGTLYYTKGNGATFSKDDNITFGDLLTVLVSNDLFSTITYTPQP